MAQRQEVLQQKLEHWCAASIRALANQSSAHFRGHRLIVNDTPLLFQVPYLKLEFSTRDSRELRGLADSMALRITHSDVELHEALKSVPDPKPDLEQLVLDLLEQLRCDSLSPDTLPGMRTNLRARFLFWANQAGHSPLTENEIGLLLYTLAVVCWSRFLRQTIPELLEERIESTRWGFSDDLKQAILQASRCLEDQTQFGQYAEAIGREITAMVASSTYQGDAEQSGAIPTRLIALAREWFTEEGTNQLSDDRGTASATDSLNLNDEPICYAVYDRTDDRESNITDLVRAAQLAKFRARLDKRLSQQSINLHRVARYLQRHMSSPVVSGWSFGEEEGYLDSSRLSLLITSPQERGLFRQRAVEPLSDSLVSILIDNSGSMTHHNEAIGLLIDMLTRALDLAGIKTEVLGFTTVDWNGGRVAKRWAAAGKPADPGRLTSTHHILYKSAETPWRRSRQAIAGLLKSDLFKEGIDGEALQWAVKRIEQRTETHKIILMISDGSPMDTATYAANSESYLDAHLVQVVADIEKRQDIRLYGLGVGLDLSAYYRDSLSIDLNQTLDMVHFLAIAEMLTKDHA